MATPMMVATNVCPLPRMVWIAAPPPTPPTTPTTAVIQVAIGLLPGTTRRPRAPIPRPRTASHKSEKKDMRPFYPTVVGRISRAYVSRSDGAEADAPSGRLAELHVGDLVRRDQDLA